MRASELVSAAVLIVLMIWIGVRPNDLLKRISPSLEGLRTQIETRLAAGRPSGMPAPSIAEKRP